jgi:vacuolar-type H+-ATPase subunit B/Vma2
VDDSRSLEDTLERAWQVASVLPRRELNLVAADDVATHYHRAEGTSPVARTSDG